MSMFLGPIHYIMFNKIKTAAGRSRAVVETFNKKYPNESEDTVKAALPEGLVDFGDTTLDELLGDNMIHTFLQGLIDQVETTEAKLVTALLYRFPEDGTELLKEAFKSHGAQTAKKAMASQNGAERNIDTALNILGEFYLEGMPCDQVSSFSSNSPGTMDVEHSDCLHRHKWENAGAPLETMCELLDKWIEGCVQEINPKIKLERETAIVKGSTTCKSKMLLS